MSTQQRASLGRADWLALAGVLGGTLAARWLPAWYRSAEVSDLSICRHMALIVRVQRFDRNGTFLSLWDTKTHARLEFW